MVYHPSHHCKRMLLSFVGQFTQAFDRRRTHVRTIMQQPVRDPYHRVRLALTYEISQGLDGTLSDLWARRCVSL